ncbi:hypothetical protein C8R44DRAFT_730260 [Mycena epipterygia]|nr:hypothetical protein C8R44DRAFT_730260 [Mycena epipterygia]
MFTSVKWYQAPTNTGMQNTCGAGPFAYLFLRNTTFVCRKCDLFEPLVEEVAVHSRFGANEAVGTRWRSTGREEWATWALCVTPATNRKHWPQAANGVGSLLRCSGCRRVSYYNPECQKHHWGEHKTLCKTLQFVENNAEYKLELIAPFRGTGENNKATLDRISVAHKARMIDLCEKALGRNAACGLLESPCDDLPERLSQCEMNRQICADAEFRGTIMIPSLAHKYMWLFIRRQPTWVSLKGLNWEAIIGSDIKRASAGTVFAAQTPACLRLVSVPPTCLSIGSAWTMKNLSLSMHSPSVPSVKILNILFCGRVPGMVPAIRGLRAVVRERDAYKSKSSESCPEGGTIFHRQSGEHYIEYVRNEGSAFETPDLCIAANRCLATSEPALWRQTRTMLVARHIPRVFTAYDRHIAERDLALLRESGANLVPSLSPAINPFGSLIMDPNFDKVYGFHAHNALFTGAFT